MSEARTFTAAEKAAEAADELALRWRVYRRLVDQKRMKQEAMDRKIALMRAIRDDYQEQARREREPQPSLF